MAKGTLDLKIIISAKDEATGAIKKLGKAIFNLRNAVIAAVGGFVSMKVLDDITSAAARQEDAEQKLAAALKAVGQFSQETAKRLKQYAGHLQSLTRYGDEDILMLQSLIIQLTGTTKHIERATKATIDLADSLGIDLRSAGLMVAKALSGNLMLLQRYGVEITKAEFESKGMVAVLEALEQKFGGVSKSMAETFRGMRTQIANLWGDVKEKIGDIIIKNEAVREVLKFVKEQLEKLNTALKNNREEMGKFVKNMVIDLVKASSIAVEVLGWIPKTVEGIKATFETLGKSISVIMTPFYTFAKLQLSILILTKKGWKELLSFWKETFQEAGGIVKAGIDDMMTSLEKSADKIENVNNITGKLKNVFVGLEDKLKNIKEVFSDTTEGISQGVGVIKNSIQGAIQSVTQRFDIVNQKAFEFSTNLQKLPEVVAPAIQQVGVEWGTLAFRLEYMSYQFTQGFIPAIKQSVLNLKHLGAEVGYTLASAVGPLVDSMVIGFKNFNQVIRDTLNSIGRLILQFMILKGISFIFPFQHGGLVPVLKKFQEGGLVAGAGLRDKIPALLTPGEFVLPKSAVRELGVSELERLRQGKRGTTIHVNLNIGTVTGGQESADSLIKMLEIKLPEIFNELKRKRIL
jgi:gas vesicle protein